MALSDLAVYSEYAYKTMTEVMDQEVEKFNAASDGTIILSPAAHQGDFSDQAFFQKIVGGTVRRRNAYGSGAIEQKRIKHIVDTSVKVAAGTPEFLIEPSNFRWIQQNPESAGVAFGVQLAKDTMADMLNTGLGATVAAMSNIAEIIQDDTGVATPGDQPSFVGLTGAAGLLGDRSSAVRAWIMHSTPMTKLWQNAITNHERLFQYSNVAVSRDPFGRLFIVTDSPALTGSTGGATPVTFFNTLGLQTGALYIGQNNDFDAMQQDHTGNENLQRTYQAEWSYQVGVAGFSWDKANGGKSPNDAALMAAANWDRYATSHKDLNGVLYRTH
jgi:hypothetical protein